MRAWFVACGIAIIGSTGCGHSGSTGNPTAPTAAPTPAPVPGSITVTGTVVEIGAGPVAGARIQIHDVAEETVTDESGRFNLTVIAPSSNRSLSATISKVGYDSAYTTLVGGSLKIELQRQRRVTGRVLDTEGTPVPFLDLAGYGGGMAQTDANGSFEIVAGHYFWLRKGGFVERSVVLPPGQDVSIGDVRIQRAIIITDPAHLRVDLSENDPEEQFFDDSDQNQSCYPCLWIDLKSGRPLQVDVHASEAMRFEVSFGDYYGTPTRTVIGPGGLDMRVQIPAGQKIILLGLATTPGVQVPLDHPVVFDLDVTAP